MSFLIVLIISISTLFLVVGTIIFTLFWRKKNLIKYIYYSLWKNVSFSALLFCTAIFLALFASFYGKISDTVFALIYLFITAFVLVFIALKEGCFCVYFSDSFLIKKTLFHQKSINLREICFLEYRPEFYWVVVAGWQMHLGSFIISAPDGTIIKVNHKKAVGDWSTFVRKCYELKGEDYYGDGFAFLLKEEKKKKMFSIFVVLSAIIFVGIIIYDTLH